MKNIPKFISTMISNNLIQNGSQPHIAHHVLEYPTDVSQERLLDLVNDGRDGGVTRADELLTTERDDQLVHQAKPQGFIIMLVQPVHVPPAQGGCLSNRIADIFLRPKGKVKERAPLGSLHRRRGPRFFSPVFKNPPLKKDQGGG